MAAKATRCVMCGRDATHVVAVHEGRRLKASAYACQAHAEAMADQAKAAGRKPKVSKLALNGGK